MLKRSTRFATVQGPGGRGFSQIPFLASVPGHPIIAQALREVSAYYKAGQPGPSMLADAFDSASESEQQDSEILTEIDLTPGKFPTLKRRGGPRCCCNYVVTDQDHNEPLFFSRIEHTGTNCTRRAFF